MFKINYRDSQFHKKVKHISISFNLETLRSPSNQTHQVVSKLPEEAGKRVVAAEGPQN